MMVLYVFSVPWPVICCPMLSANASSRRFRTLASLHSAEYPWFAEWRSYSMASRIDCSSLSTSSSVALTLRSAARADSTRSPFWMYQRGVSGRKKTWLTMRMGMSSWKTMTMRQSHWPSRRSCREQPKRTQ
jgi:hypothetical protein